MITSDLSGKTALITGGGSGIGRATAELFIACGAAVAVNHLPGDAVALAAIEEMRAAGTVISAPGDVSDAISAPAMVRAAITELGGLDILINNAGTAVSPVPTDFKDLDAMTDAFWSATINTNLLGAFRCTREAAPELKAAGGAVVSTASVAGLGLRGSSIAYGASKGAVRQMTKSVAIDCARKGLGIRCN